MDKQTVKKTDLTFGKIQEFKIDEESKQRENPTYLESDLGFRRHDEKDHFEGHGTIRLSEIKTLIRNPKQFIWLFGVEMGYHLPPKSFITWPYIISVLMGEKKLVKNMFVTLSTGIPKFA